MESNINIKIEDFKKSVKLVFEQNNGFDIAPSSNKMVVFDQRLLVKDAFLGLIEQDLKCGLVLDGISKKITKIITVSDFINIILYSHEKGNKVDLEALTILRWNEITNMNNLKYIMSSDSLLEGIRIMMLNNIHRLPVLSEVPNKILCVLNYQRILRFVLKRFLMEDKTPDLLKEIKIKDLVNAGLGTFGNLIVCNINDPVIKTLLRFRDDKIHCIPLIDDDGVYVDSYTSSDVRYLALDGTYKNLSTSVKEALGTHHERKHGKVIECTLEETLFDFTNKIIRSRKYASICMDGNRKVLGMINVVDVISFILSDNCGETEKN